MKKPASQPPSRSMRQRQSGAVLVMMGLMLAVLIGFASLAIDLGRTYVVRTELQNAADAAALAGAKELNQTPKGVENAVSYAKAIARQNRFNFGKEVIITDDDLSVGKCPGSETACDWKPVASIKSDGDAAGRTFFKVDIASGSLGTFLRGYLPGVGLIGTTSTSTYGIAVAGRYLLALSPIGVCALQESGVSILAPRKLLPSGELAEYGFRRGVSYNIFQLGPLGTPSDPYLLNPVDIYDAANPTACDPNNSSATVTAPFACTGVTAALPSTLPGSMYGNTGVSAGKIEAALNSRFGDYSAPSVCTPAEAPPDGNTREYTPTVAGSAVADGGWMSGVPNRQTMRYPEAGVVSTVTIPSAADYGVLWSYSHAVQAAPADCITNCTPGSDFPSTPLLQAQAAWSALYPVTSGASPQPVTDLSKLPYWRDLPGSTPAERIGRRVLNLAIVNCPAATDTGGCRRIPIEAVGRFFMQVRADFKGSPKKLEVEFAGLVSPPPAEIMLYSDR